MRPVDQFSILLLLIGAYTEMSCDALPNNSTAYTAKDASVLELQNLGPCNDRTYFHDNVAATVFTRDGAKDYCVRARMVLADFRTLAEFNCVISKLRDTTYYWTDWRPSMTRSCTISDNLSYFPDGVYFKSEVKLGLIIGNTISDTDRLLSRTIDQFYRPLCMLL